MSKTHPRRSRRGPILSKVEPYIATGCLRHLENERIFKEFLENLEKV